MYEEKVEVVDDDPVPKPPMEHFNDMDDEQCEPNRDEVSTTDYISQRTNQLTGWGQDGLNVLMWGRPPRKTHNILPSQASSVPCKQLFSGTKQVATDCWASLGSIVFEEVTITKSAWGPGLCDIVAWSAAQMEGIAQLDLDFGQMLVDQDRWDKPMPCLDLDWFS